VLSELHRVVGEVDAALEEFDPTRAGRASGSTRGRAGCT